MDVPCVVAIPGRPPCKARLTTDHAMSSYGLPVVVAQGMAYGAAEVLWLDGAPSTLAEAARAGYPILSAENSQWPIGYDAVV